MELVTFCALRFHGVKRDVELAGNTGRAAYESFDGLWDSHYARTLDLHPEAIHNFAIFFYLQRRLKWLDELSSREALVFIRLFVHLHDQPVPDGYESQEWCRRYEGRRADVPALAARLRPPKR